MIPSKYLEIDKATQSLYDAGFLVYTPNAEADETIQVISSTLDLYKNMILLYPYEIYEIFKDTKEFLLDDRRGIILNRNYLTSDNYNDLLIMNQFTVVSSFLIAWHRLCGNNTWKKEGTNIYLQLMTSLGLNANELIMECIQCEKVWMKDMKQAGVAPKKKISFISIVAVLALVGIGYKIFF